MSSYKSSRVSQIHRDLHDRLPSDSALRVKALETLLVGKGLLDSAAVDAWIDLFAEEIGPKRGARVIARAWVDEAFKARLLADGTAAIGEMGISGHALGHLVAVENTNAIHNLVVCTLCSCYPVGLLGMSPGWYKSNEYRSRAVRDPRSVLAEFGIKLDRNVEVRVWDSTSELRYLVVPQRPKGTDHLDEAALAALVTRNSMIGAGLIAAPGEGGA